MHRATGGRVLKSSFLIRKQSSTNRKSGQRSFVETAKDELFLPRIGIDIAHGVNARGAGLEAFGIDVDLICLLYTSPSPRDLSTSRMPSSA